MVCVAGDVCDILDVLHDGVSGQEEVEACWNRNGWWLEATIWVKGIPIRYKTWKEVEMCYGSFEFDSPTRIKYGIGIVESVGEEVSKFAARKVLIVADRGSIKKWQPTIR